MFWKFRQPQYLVVSTYPYSLSGICLYLTHLVLKTVSNIVLLVIVFKSCYGISTFYRRYMMDIIRRNLDFIGKIQLKIRTFSDCLWRITIFDASCLWRTLYLTHLCIFCAIYTRYMGDFFSHFCAKCYICIVFFAWFLCNFLGW